MLLICWKKCKNGRNVKKIEKKNRREKSVKKVKRLKKNILYIFTLVNLVLLVLMYITFTAWIINGEIIGPPLDYDFHNRFFQFSFYYNVITLIPFVISSLFIILLRIKWVLITGAAGISLYIGGIVIISSVHNNQMIFPNYTTNLILAIIVLIGYFAIYISLIIFRYKLGFSEKTKTFQGDKLKRIMKVSNKIRLDILRDLLEMDQNTFNNKLINLLKQFGTKVEGNYIIVNKETLPELFKELDEKREGWDTMEIFKVKKV